MAEEERVRFSKGFWALLGVWAATWFYWAFRFHGHFPAYMDTLEYSFPEKWVNVEQFKAGIIPLWNPWIACGTPHLAQSQPAPFYPPHLLWNLTGLTDWFFWMAQAHSAWASLGFFLWTRRLKVRPVPALLGAVSFGGCALMTQFWGFPTHLSTLAWIPWIFWACDRALERRTFGAYFIFSACAGMQILSGYAFFTLFTGLFMALWLLFHKKPGARQWGAIFLAGLGALAVSAVQWLPFLDYLGYAHRDSWGHTPFCFTPIEFLTLLKPDILGVPGTAGFQGVYGNYIYNPYFGLLPLAAFLVGLCVKRYRAPFYAFSALGMLALATGFRFLPDALQPHGLVNFLEPVKASPLFVFAAITAALLSLEKWTAQRRWTVGMGGALLACLWLADLAAVPFGLVHLIGDPYRQADVAHDAGDLRQSAGTGRFVTMRERDALYPKGEGTFEESFRYQARWAAPNTNEVWGIRSVDGYLSSSVDGFQDIRRYLARGIGNERLLDAAGVRALLLPHTPPFRKYQIQRTLAGAELSRNAGADNLLNGWRAPYVKSFPDRASVLLAMMDPNAFLEENIYSETESDGKAVRLPAPVRELSHRDSAQYGILEKLAGRLDRFLNGGSTVTANRISPCLQEFEVNFDEQGWLAFNETYAPGWRAWVDGRPQVIFRAYGLFMAVPVKGIGLHRIQFRYEPSAFRLGLFVSLAALTAFLMAGLGKLPGWPKGL